MSIQRSSRRIAAAAIAAATLLVASACGGGDANGEAFEGESIKVGVFPSFNAVAAYTDKVKSTLEDDGHKVEFSAELELMPKEMPHRTWPHEQRTLNLWGSAWMRS